MIINDIIVCLEYQGFERVRVNVDTIYLYHKVQNMNHYFVYVFSTEHGQEFHKETQEHMIAQIEARLQSSYQNVQCLKLMIANEAMGIRTMMEHDSYVWYIDSTTNRLVMYENQISKFLLLEQEIPRLLESRNNLNGSKETYPFVSKTSKTILLQRIRYQGISLCSVGIITMNVLVFVWLEFFVDGIRHQEIVEQFGLYWPAVRYEHEYYRLFTCMFLHSGFDHLLNNMLVLYIIGNNLERVVGPIKYFIIYIGAGLLAGLVSMGYNMHIKQEILSVGASGAIFGIVGAVAYIIIMNKGRCKEIGKRQIVLFVFFSLYGGFTSVQVDNAAHIGGVITGALITMLLYRKPKEMRN